MTFFITADENSHNIYSLKGLQNYPYKTSPIVIQTLVFKNDLQYAYNVAYTSMNSTVSARLSIPAVKSENIKGIVIMLRGHYHTSGYYTGRGTEVPARYYLSRGWAVIAPDFFGYGASSPIPSPGELYQFYSTVNAIELYKSLENPNFRFSQGISQENRANLGGSFKKIGLWGHSNGGQAALHLLTVIKKPVPTVLWAPVSLPFPDSWAHYRRNPGWAEYFKSVYNAADFSFLAHLDKIAPGTPILVNHGDKDTSVPKAWNDALSGHIAAENARREKAGIGKINFRYDIYPGADHSLLPRSNWDIVQQQDVDFWEKYPQ